MQMLHNNSLWLFPLYVSSRTLPRTDGQVASKKHVHEVLELIRNLEAESFSDHHVPRGAKLFVQHLFDHLGRVFVVGRVFLAGIHAHFHHLGLHFVRHVCLLDHWVRIDDPFA